MTAAGRLLLLVVVVAVLIAAYTAIGPKPGNPRPVTPRPPAGPQQPPRPR